MIMAGKLTALDSLEAAWQAHLPSLSHLVHVVYAHVHASALVLCINSVLPRYRDRHSQTRSPLESAGAA